MRIHRQTLAVKTIRLRCRYHFEEETSVSCQMPLPVGGAQNRRVALRIDSGGQINAVRIRRVHGETFNAGQIRAGNPVGDRNPMFSRIAPSDTLPPTSMRT